MRMNDRVSSICAKEKKGNVFFNKDITQFSKKKQQFRDGLKKEKVYGIFH